jgi:hypothetical protein
VDGKQLAAVCREHLVPSALVRVGCLRIRGGRGVRHVMAAANAYEAPFQISSRNKDNPKIGQQRTTLRQWSDSANQIRVVVEVVPRLHRTAGPYSWVSGPLSGPPHGLARNIKITTILRLDR